MAKTERQVVISTTPERVFDVIVDYERYPEFLPEMKEVEILSRDSGLALVRFELEIVMRIGYTLRLQEDRPTSVTWSLHRAKMMAANNGGWKLEVLPGGETRATYGIDVRLRGLIPKSVSDRLVSTTLPATLERFKARAESLGG